MRIIFNSCMNNRNTNIQIGHNSPSIKLHYDGWLWIKIDTCSDIEKKKRLFSFHTNIFIIVHMWRGRKQEGINLSPSLILTFFFLCFSFFFHIISVHKTIIDGNSILFFNFDKLFFIESFHFP